MSTATVLITGASRGIGKGLVANFLSRDNHTVIAAVRDASHTNAQGLSSLPTGSGSKLIVISLDAGNQASIQAAISKLDSEHKISSLDIVIANAGIAGALTRPLETTEKDFLETISVNSFGPLWLYQETQPLLKKSVHAPAKFMAISSVGGSLTKMDANNTANFPIYSGSKTLLNMIMRTITIAEPELVVFSICPGFVQTDMGNRGAKLFGMEKATLTVQESLDGVMAVLDKADKETSGKFMSQDGTEIPW